MKRRFLLIFLGLFILGILVFGWQNASNKRSQATSGPPVIGIASVLNKKYMEAIRESGGIPMVLPDDDRSPDRIANYLEILDGLLMPGGADIPPSEYGEEPHETVRLLSENRFQFEKALSEAWIEKSDKPMLGICLGVQWINVSSGGSLVQDIPSALGGNHRNVTHNVVLEPNSRLARIFDGELQFPVNSLHHQAVKDLGKGLKTVARSPDGVIEATETTNPDRFLIGVQWHPEKLFANDPRQQKLFKAFVKAAAEND